MSAVDAAACCAAFYEQDWVRLLLGDSFHPGGEDLSRQLVDDLQLGPGAHVVDLACGTGTTALLVHDAWDVTVTGVDFSERNLERARLRATDRTDLRFVQAEASALPFDDDSVHAVLCECAVSTFADKPGVAAEIARVLVPGGRFVMTDMAVYAALPDDMAAFGRGWACVDDALTVEGYEALLVAAGLQPLAITDCSEGLRSMLLQLKRKLLLAGLGQLSGAAALDLDIDELRGMIASARALVDEGTVRYARLDFSLGEPALPAASARRPPTEACDPSTGCCP
ncbi:MAG: methyltransferase domain-containing protein [Myxococcales bacterium]|nr:methyltransferase domain-containing protein [Myxococcales bacterium]